MNENRNHGGGIGCLGVLQVVFLVLKLTNLIDWSWWWVMSPSILWFIIAVVVILTIIVIKWSRS